MRTEKLYPRHKHSPNSFRKFVEFDIILMHTRLNVVRQTVEIFRYLSNEELDEIDSSCAL